MTKRKTGSENRWLIGIAVVIGLAVGALFGPTFMQSAVDAPQTSIAAVADMTAEQQLAWAEQLVQSNFASKLAETDVVLGDPDAPVTIVEFSDFQCPFCRRYALQTLPEIKKNFIDMGKVKYIYRDYTQPNESYHPGGYFAAQAAECAAEQDLYWQAHAQIFAKQAEQGTGTIRFGDAEVRAWFAKIDGLDQAAWQTCYDEGRYISEIDKDTRDGASYGVTGTPFFFVNGVSISGAQPYPAFAGAIQRALRDL